MKWFILKMTYYGQTTFRLESDEVSLLINPGIWDGEPIIPNDHDVRVIVATNHADDALGNATEIATQSKAWILGNEATIQKVQSQGGKSWLLHTLRPEVLYEIPGMKLTPFSLQRLDAESGGRYENLGLYIEIGRMKVAYLGDTIVRGPFGSLEIDILITPVGGNDVFGVKDATSLCVDAQPRLAIPMKWTAPEQPKKFAKYIDQFGRGTVPLIVEPGQIVETEWAAGNEFRYTLN
ncbi:MAG: MBL fold metallo-hydrolase [Candidatus Thorarchaeota archaeon]|nr:MBL fold metallo-hydrolase [Candidatus Thorarchaeota archaeon]